MHGAGGLLIALQRGGRCVLRASVKLAVGLWTPLLAGCGCPPFSEMTVTNPEAVASAVHLYEVSRGIAHFERWTGWRTVCVPEVQIRSEILEGRATGLYQGPMNPILVVPEAGERTTVHELCHAADQRLGWLSDEHPELFPVTHIEPVLYRSRSSQVHESFARACEAGPEGLGLVRAVEARCGVPLEHPGYSLVLDEVYEAAPSVARSAALRSLQTEEISVDAIVGDGTLLDVASGGRLIWMVIRDPDPLLEAGDLTDFFTRQMWRVVGWSPVTRQAEVIHTLLRRPPTLLSGHGDLRHFRLLDSVEDPILVEGTARATTHLWRLDEQTGGMVRLADQPYVTGGEGAQSLSGGVVQNGVALLRVDNPPEDVAGALQSPNRSPVYEGLAGQGWVAIELDSGRVIDDHSIYDGWFDARLSGGTLTLTATVDGTTWGSGSYDATSQIWAPDLVRTVDEAGSAKVWRTSAAALSNPVTVDPSGRVLALWSNPQIWHAVDLRKFPVLSDPASNTYWVPDDLCTSGDTGAFILRIMHVNGELWLLESRDSSRVRLRRIAAE